METKYYIVARIDGDYAWLNRTDAEEEPLFIDGLLMERHMAKVARRKSKNHLKGPAKRTEKDVRRFEESFRKLIMEARNNYVFR